MTEGPDHAHPDRADRAKGEDGDHAAQESAGRAAVRRLLIARLDDAGMQRARGTKVETHQAMVERLVAALSYMTPENLRTLADLVLKLAQGADRCHWPPEASVLGYARALQRPPLRDDRIVTSWLASVEGPPARAGGWHVALYRFLRDRRLPPLGHDAQKIRAQGEDDTRRLRLYQERIDKGIATADERAWVVAFLRDRAEVEAIIDRGESVRAARAAGVADAA